MRRLSTALGVLEAVVVGRDGVAASFEDEGVDDELDKGIVAERVGALDASRLDADWEGPSSAATCAEREMNFLYSYLSAELLACAIRAKGIGRLTSDVLLQLTVPFRVDHVRGRRMPRLVGVEVRV